MNIIDSVTIYGLWQDSPNIHFALDRNKNFLIGKNGTGKTTIINLLAAALTCDTEKLLNIDFKKITIKLAQAANSSRKPSITVIKDPSEPELFTYEFKSSQSDSHPLILTTHTDEQRSYPFSFSSYLSLKNSFTREILIHLEESISVTWLSVSRSPNIHTKKDDIDKKYSTIDIKLSEIKSELIKFFTSLSNKYAEEVVKFQKNTLFSILTPEEKFKTIIENTSKSIDIAKEREALSSIFKMLGADQRTVKKKIDRHLKSFQEALNNHKNDPSKTTYEEILAVYHTLRAHQLVQDYEELEAKRKNIFKPMTDFTKEINALFEGRKKINFNEKNEMLFSTKNKKEINPEDLSSGEKQLIIMLGEALIKSSKPSIYIADEPELSLHISWQENLVQAISRISPNTQIIFATHSPDIVGGDSGNIIDMEAINP